MQIELMNWIGWLPSRATLSIVAFGLTVAACGEGGKGDINPAVEPAADDGANLPNTGPGDAVTQTEETPPSDVVVDAVEGSDDSATTNEGTPPVVVDDTPADAGSDDSDITSEEAAPDVASADETEELVPPSDSEHQPEGPEVACSGCVDDTEAEYVSPSPDDDCVSDDLRGGSSVAALTAFWALIRFEKDQGFGPLVASPTLDSQVIAKARQDECFYGIGSSEPMAAVTARGEVCGVSPNVGIPKTNGAYAWSLAYVGDRIWVGTLANALCLISQGFFGASTPFITPYFTCEYAENALFGTDWRPPEMLRVNPAPPYDRQDLTATMSVEAKTLLYDTIGIRSVGNTGAVVFFAGPSARTSGINMFAFDATTGASLGAQHYAEYNDVRRWVYAGGALYVALGLTDTTEFGGAVLRWTGTAASPFQFITVGNLDAMGSEIIEHNGRLVAGTWPAGFGWDKQGQAVAGIYMSPLLGTEGLDAADADRWQKIWSVADYDPDQLAAATTGIGAMASYKGKLFFGTMHVPFVAFAAALQKPELFDRDGDGLETDELLVTYLGTHRSTSFFAGEDLGGDCPRFRVVYGERYLPVYDAALLSYSIEYDCAHKNLMAQRPEQGASGFGNYFNNYVWASIVHDDELYLGTFDSSSIAVAGLVEAVLSAGIPGVALDPEQVDALLTAIGGNVPTVGADFLRIVDAGGRASAESFNGVGNYLNYGIRNFAASDGLLYAATANPFNLDEEGGWEIIELSGKEEPPPLAATFTPSEHGHDWWVAVKVEANAPLASVDAQVNAGDWRSLEPTPWGTWGKSLHAVYGSVVQFRATAVTGAVVMSPRFIWPSGEVAPADLEFDACFQRVRGNEGWVQTSVYANGPLDAVYARQDSGDWVKLCPIDWDWDAYGSGLDVAPDSSVEFKACPVQGACDVSPEYLWPDSSSCDAASLAAP